MLIVLPSTTFEFSDSPFAAASARVVKLFAAAIDQSDSPGWTTCGTAAVAEVATTRLVMVARPNRRERFPMPGRFPAGLPGDPRYGRLHVPVHERGMDTLCVMASKRQIW